MCRAQPTTRQTALPPDASCEDIEIDPHLPFLNAFVQAALQSGAAPYIPGAPASFCVLAYCFHVNHLP